MSEEEDEIDLDEDFQLDSYEEDDEFDEELGLALLAAKKTSKKDKKKGPAKNESASEEDHQHNNQAPNANAGAQPQDEGKKKRKRKKKKKKPNTSVYVQGLPLDVTMDEMVEFFKKAGIIAKDPYDFYRVQAFLSFSLPVTPKIKIYKDEQDKPKGDALVTYLKPLAVASAFDLLHEADFRPPKRFLIKLQIPEFDNTKAVNVKHAGKKLAKKKKLNQEQEALGWEEKEQVHVIIKHMFDPNDPATIRHDFYETLKNEIRGEMEKMGPVASIKVFERNPEGVVAVKYKAALAAQRCINIMDGRYFDGRKLEASYYDGHSNYFVEESEEEKKKREEAWSRWLEGNDENDERTARERGDAAGQAHEASTDSEARSDESSELDV